MAYVVINKNVSGLSHGHDRVVQAHNFGGDLAGAHDIPGSRVCLLETEGVPAADRHGCCQAVRTDSRSGQDRQERSCDRNFLKEWLKGRTSEAFRAVTFLRI